MNTKRSTFTGKIGFVLAAAGSAVGLGNIWRFPYLAAQYGGGIFLLVYLILAVTFGFALMVGEIALGRKTGLSAIGAFRTLNKRFSFLGWLAAVVPAIILPYYCVIGGWVIKYLVAFVSGNAAAAAGGDYFGSFIGSASGEPFYWFLLYVVLTAVVVFLGVDKGVERFSKILMPVLILLSIGIAIYSITLPGAMDGVIYYIKPNFSAFSIKTVLAAMGQLFYSMSLAMGIMITYGSYMKKEVNLEASVTQIEIFDTGIAFLAGLMIIPAVFALSGGANINAGPGLMFVTLPELFSEMTGGTIVGILFFVLVLFAALTSSISLMETVVSIITDKTGIGRKAGCLIVVVGCIVIGSLSALGYGILGNIKILGMQFLDFFDFISNSVLMPVVALLTCVFIGYVIKPQTIIDEVELNSRFRRKQLFVLMIKYLAPICIVLILVSSVLSAFGLLTL